MAFPVGTVLRPALDRFIERVELQDDGCMVWTGGTVGPDRSYGGFFAGRTAPGQSGKARAHRWSYETFVEPIPEGLEIDHLCRNGLCVNPDHLEPVTRQVNLDRSHGNARKTHCPRNHPYDDANTYITRSGSRICKACRAEGQRRHRARKRTT